jgi:hypothetical protein
VRLGAVLPFTQVPALLRFLTGVQVARDTVRRLTEEAGAAQVGVEAADLQQIQREECPVPEGPAVQQLSADGAMVPFQQGKWAEARTLAVGTVAHTRGKGEPEIHTQDVSYFSRLCPAEVFVELATLPLQQRGTERAGTVVAVMDGAPWLQELIDAHRPDAVRIPGTRLRVFPHAAGYLSQAAQAAFGAGSREAAVWLDHWLPTLKEETPAEVLDAIRALPTTTPEASGTKATVIRYLRQRLEQLQYAAFQEHGYPIGSRMVESGNKLVVEARLKGAGMSTPYRSGARRNLNPMLALRGLVCRRSWEQSWCRIWRQLRWQVAERRRQRRAQRQEANLSLPAASPVPPPDRPPHPKQVIDGRPTSDHPWSHGYDQRLLAQAHARI